MAVSEEDRSAAIETALANHDPDTEGTLRLPWHDGYKIFPVIELSLDAVVLNPDSHRIQAQLESHPDCEVVESDPFGDQAQEIIADVLRNQIEGFDVLRQNLAEDDQRDAGVITPVGLLVNANRRAVALRDNGAGYIRVAALPQASGTEISDLELGLQLQVEFRQDYTFTNRLLFVDELISIQGRTEDQVARALNVAAATNDRELEKGRAKVSQDTRVLDLIRAIQQRSAEKIPLTFFDGQEIAFEELDNRFEETADPDLATRLRETRILGILAGVPYRDLRRFDAEALDAYIVPRFEDDDSFSEIWPSLVPAAQVADGNGPEGIDVLEGGDGAPDEAAETTGRLTALVDLLATTYSDPEITVPTTEGDRTEEREPVVNRLQLTLREAAAEIADSQRRDSRLERPYNRASEAERKLRSAAEAYEKVKDDGDFDPEPVRGALQRAKERAEALITELDS